MKLFNIRRKTKGKITYNIQATNANLVAFFRFLGANIFINND